MSQCLGTFGDYSNKIMNSLFVTFLLSEAAGTNTNTYGVQSTVLIFHYRSPDLFEARYKVLAALIMHTTVFRDVMQCSLLVV
jgi:uncharacterized membrane protein